MQVVAIPISVICNFDKKGNPTPVRFRTDLESESVIIEVDQILYIDKERLAGNPMWVFRCKSAIRDRMTEYELKQEITTGKWMLWRI